MKIIYTLFLLVLVISQNLSAQVIQGNVKHPVSHQTLQQQKAARLPKLNNNLRDIYQMYVDYDAANFDDNGYAWFYNTDYVAADTAGLNYGYMNYIAVAMKNIAGYTDPTDPQGTYTDWSFLGLDDSFPSNIQITVDTIYAHVGQENNSGENDTLQMQLVKVLTNGSPSTVSSGVLWSQRDSFNAPLSPSNDWTMDQPIIAWGPEYLNTPGQKIAGVLKYYNKNKNDTMIVTAGFVDNGSGGADQPSAFFTSYVRPCYLSSIYWTGALTYGDGTYFAAADWDIFYLITINTVLGISDNFDNLKVHFVAPNPASDKTDVWFGLNDASDVSIKLLDISGKYIKTIKTAHYGAGSFVEPIDVSDLNSGIYLVSVQAGDNTPVISKLSVNR